MPRETRNDGSAMIRAYKTIQGKNDVKIDRSKVIDLKKRAQK